MALRVIGCRTQFIKQILLEGVRLDIVKKLNEIEDHFKNISSEEFEKALIR